MITHYDLFAGIGGFSLALEEVFTNDSIKHIFCEWERFPTAVLKRHWPDGEFWGDIAELVTHTQRTGLQGEQLETEAARRHDKLDRSGLDQEREGFTIVTGGFPCQPFSHAGQRKGTADDRYQWPNMFAVIRNTQPKWVIAENVRGLVTWNDGMVLETVCSDLESQGYEVQPFIIPAVAVGAPHRRDRVWIIAHRNGEPIKRWSRPASVSKANARATGANEGEREEGVSEARQRTQYEPHGNSSIITDTRPQRRQPRVSKDIRPSRQESERQDRQYPDWSRNWQEVAFATCDDSMDDGLSRLVDGVPYSRAKWRKDSLKAYGNGIVMQVAMRIMKGIYAAERAR